MGKKNRGPSPRYIRRPFKNPPEAFPRDSNELIDLDVYLEYLVDDPEDAPIEIKDDEKALWQPQHIYFQGPFYGQYSERSYMRDQVLTEFQSSPYNQIIMRRIQELKVHRRFEEHVSPPAPETMRQSLIDFRRLDILGAAAIGKRIALVPEALEYLVHGTNPPKDNFGLSPLERANFFDEELRVSLEALQSPLVTPQRLVTGAIRRTARLINSESLNEEAERRLEEDGVYIPVRLRKPGFLYGLSNTMLEQMTSVTYIRPDKEIPLEPLQTGVDRVQLAA